MNVVGKQVYIFSCKDAEATFQNLVVPLSKMRQVFYQNGE